MRIFEFLSFNRLGISRRGFVNSFIPNNFLPVQPFITASYRVVVALPITRSYRLSPKRSGLVTTCGHRTRLF